MSPTVIFSEFDSGEFFLTAGVVFIFGLVIGSFLNVVILRLGRKGVVTGRSSCPHCNRTLTFLDLIPVLSFIFLLGRCRSCRQTISWQYPLVEFATGALFVFTFGFWLDSWSVTSGSDLWQFSFWFSLVLVLLIWSCLVVIFVYDLKHKIIPDRAVFTFIGLALIWWGWSFFFGEGVFALGWLDLLAGPVLFFLFWLPWYFSRGRWMGFGDVKLVLGIGFFLGLVSGLSAVVLAFWLGAGVALALIGLSRFLAWSQWPLRWSFLTTVSMKSEIPFGPFLVIALVINFFWRLDVLGLAFYFDLF